MIMKKTITLASSALTALTLLAVAAPAFAASTSATTYDLTNSVTFEQGDGTIDPSNPIIDPSKPTDPPTDITPTPGVLALDNASDINFGTHKIDGSTTDFVAQKSDNGFASGTTGDFQPNVMWHDLRGAGSKNFTITASLSKDFDMTGTTVTYGAGTVSNVTPNGNGDKTAVTDAGGFKLGTGSQDVLVASDSGSVSGYYSDLFSKATISVPVNAQTAGSHSATVTWNLTVAQ